MTLHYGSTGPTRLGELLTLAALAALVAVAVVGLAGPAGRRPAAGGRPAGQARGRPGPEPRPAVSRTLGMFPLSTVLFPHAAFRCTCSRSAIGP